jgi:hypothetical protein
MQELTENKKYLVRIDDRDWIVQMIDDAEYTVEYTDRDKQAKIVQTDNHPTSQNCTGTYYEYNDTCPHIRAVQKIKNADEDTRLAMDCDYQLYADNDELQDTPFQSIFQGESQN